MAYTKIIVIRGRLDKCLRYAANEEKTYLETAVDYTLDRDKTERVCFETEINCGRDTAYEDMAQTAQRWGKQNRMRKGYMPHCRRWRWRPLRERARPRWDVPSSKAIWACAWRAR